MTAIADDVLVDITIYELCLNMNVDNFKKNYCIPRRHMLYCYGK